VKPALIGEIRKGRHLAEFALSGLNDVPGELVRVAQPFARHAVNILSGFHNTNTSQWTFFTDFTESDTTPAEIVRELEELAQPCKVAFKDAANGVLIDSLNFPLMWGRHRVMIIRAEIMSATISCLWELFGKDSPVAAVILHHMGEAGGRVTAALAQEMGSEVSECIPSILDLYSSAGWGVLNALNVDTTQGTVEVRAIDNFECLAHRGEGGVGYSHFLRGHLAGLFSELFSKRVEAVETNCIVQAAPHCTFNIAPQGRSP
jgi:predicted hydrocarbon binding protein